MRTYTGPGKEGLREKNKTPKIIMEEYEKALKLDESSKLTPDQLLEWFYIYIIKHTECFYILLFL